MMECLYYDQPYLTRFEARVRSCAERDGLFHVALDRTAFYPTSGGQPFDTGALGGARVSDVYLDAAGEIVHVVDRLLAIGGTVIGEIDWARRFDHMQQHAADHMIAGAVWRMYGGTTIGLHLGEAFSTIDIVMPGGATHLSAAQVDEIELLVNRDVQADLPIRCFFPDETELRSLPLRKTPTVEENIRVVLIGDEECVACGGTHPTGTGRIGLVKILWTAPSRGKLRLAFVAGMRAVRDYQARYGASEAASALLSCKPERLPEAVSAQAERIKSLELELARLKRAGVLALCEPLLDGADVLGDGTRLVARAFDDLDIHALKELAKRLIGRPRVCALLALVRPEGGVSMLFARSPGEGADLGALMSEAAARFSGKGGGRPDFAQGAAADMAALDFARQKLCKLLPNAYRS